MSVTRKNFLQRTTDGKYLRTNGTWGTGITSSARSESSRGSIGAVAASKSYTFQRITKQYTKS